MNPRLHRWSLHACPIVCFLGLSALLIPPTARAAGPAAPDAASLLSTRDPFSRSEPLATRDLGLGGARGLPSTPDWYVESNQANAEFGICVATAGDVNGDGYSDLIVGADSYTSGHQYEGAAFVYLGSADGLQDSFQWMAVGGQADAAFGLSVAPAGDVNADGYADVIVGAPYYVNGEASEGRACVYLGSADGLSSTPVWTFESNRANTYAGYCVAPAGDVNADGYDDILVGAPGYTAGESEEGRVYCFLGSATGISTASPWRYESNLAGAKFGTSVATAGDVDGDGYADIIVGAPYATSAGGLASAGRAYIFRGSSTGLNTTPAWTRDGDAAGDIFGRSVAGAGDVNCDGYADVIVGAPYVDGGTGLVNAGRAYVFHGAAGSPSQSPSWTDTGDHASDQFGFSVSTAGDADGDMFADVVVGALDYNTGSGDLGAAYVYEGSLSGLDAQPIWLEAADNPSTGYAASVATAGDVNGDGFSDLTVGAFRISNPDSWEGAAYVYHGGPADPPAEAAWSQVGTLNEMLGFAVGTAGDVNGDGYGDVLVAAPYFGNTSHVGRVWVYNGAAGGATPSSSWYATGGQYDGRFGYSTATAGDVNGDGYSDVIVGAYLYDTPAGADAGRVFIYYGASSGLSSTPAVELDGSSAGEGFGLSVASAGDVNNDGYGDVIIGSPFYTGSHTHVGRASVYLGSETGISGSPAWILHGSQAEVEFGYCVASAGDVNGDGYSDVIVGAPARGTMTAGQAFVYLGSVGGLATVPSWVNGIGEAGDAYGYAVASAGDVNGDGFDDVVVGAPDFDCGDTTDGGAVRTYFGSALGLDTDWFYSVCNTQEAAHQGAAVGPAGDVNSDGYADVIMTAYNADFGETDEGYVQVYMGAYWGFGHVVYHWQGNETNAHLGYAAGTAGDVNGDGFDDLIIGAPGSSTDDGRVHVYEGNGRTATDVGRPFRVNQLTSDALPIAWLGTSDSETGFQLHVTGRSAAGRARVRMEWSVAELSVPLASVPVEATGWEMTGHADPGGSVSSMTQPVTGLSAGTSHHWRLRIASHSPFFPRTPWLSLPRTVPSEKQLRTAGVNPSAVTEITPVSALKLVCANPSFGSRRTIAYSLAQRGLVRLSIHDASGRCVATLVDGIEDAGMHEATWNQAELTGGVYFARLEAAGHVEMAKLVLVK
jgi:hypothetical protein